MFNFSDQNSPVCRLLKNPMLVCIILMFFMSSTALGLTAGGQAETVAVYRDGECSVITTTAVSADAILSQQKIDLSRGESYEYYTTSFGKALLVGRPFNVTVDDNGVFITRTFCSGSVSVIFDIMGMSLDENEVADLPLGTILTEDTTITINTLSFNEETDILEIPFEIICEDSDEIAAGESLTVSDGVAGQLAQTYSVTYDNYGYCIGRELVSETVVREPVNLVILNGTGTATAPEYEDEIIEEHKEEQKAADEAKQASAVTTSTGITSCSGVNSRLISPLTTGTTIPVDASGRPVSYSSCITATATAYCTGTTTATGEAAQPGLIAVNPRQIPYGTVMYIVTPDGSYVYGVSKASDTGGFVSSSSVKVDLYMSSLSDCIQFGRRTVEIYFI